MDDAIALLGNHERMMLNALALEPNKNKINDMLLWLRNVGQRTLDSYNNKKRIMKTHLEYFASLPLYVESDNYFFVHFAELTDRLLLILLGTGSNSFCIVNWIPAPMIMNVDIPFFFR